MPIDIKVRPNGRIVGINPVISKGHEYHYTVKGGVRFWASTSGIEKYSDEYYRMYARMRFRTGALDERASARAHDGTPFGKALERSAQKRAKAMGREFNLPIGWAVEAFFRQHGLCAVSGMRMERNDERRSAFSPSIDRIDSAVGYTPENCRLVCLIVNYGMNRFGAAAFHEMCEAVVSRRGARTGTEPELPNCATHDQTGI